MDWASIGASALGSVVEQIFDNKGYHDRRSFAERESNLSRMQADQQFNRNVELQKEFAKHGLRWKVEDAKAAGLSPSAALGAGGAAFAPVTVGSSSVDFSEPDPMSKMGQNISRAIRATGTKEERAMSQLALERATLENELLRAKIVQTSQTGPAFPGSTNFMPGQGDGNLVQPQPTKPNVSQPGRPAQEAGWRPDVSYSRGDKALHPVIPQGLSESMEDDIIGKLFWRLRNQFVPNFTNTGAPPKNQLPPGYNSWQWDQRQQGWVPVRSVPRKFNKRLGPTF